MLKSEIWLFFLSVCSSCLSDNSTWSKCGVWTGTHTCLSFAYLTFAYAKRNTFIHLLNSCKALKLIQLPESPLLHLL